jgi:putative acetyltransferase
LVLLVTAQQDELVARYGDSDDHGFLQPPLHPDTIWLLLVHDGRPAGCAAVQPLSHTDPTATPQQGEVKRLYVAPDHRGQGLSKVLMDGLEAAARVAGYVGLQLETGLRQPEALALYRNTGWTQITPYGHYRNSVLSVGFAKSL